MEKHAELFDQKNGSSLWIVETLGKERSTCTIHKKGRLYGK